MWDIEQEQQEQPCFSPTLTAPYPRPNSLSYGNVTHFSRGHQTQCRHKPHPLLPSHTPFPDLVPISWAWSGPTDIKETGVRNRSLIGLVLYFQANHGTKMQSHAESSFPRDSLSSMGFPRLPGGYPRPCQHSGLAACSQIRRARLGIWTGHAPEKCHARGRDGEKGANPAAGQWPTVGCAATRRRSSPGNRRYRDVRKFFNSACAK